MDTTQLLDKFKTMLLSSDTGSAYRDVQAGLADIKPRTISLHRGKVKSVKKVESTKDEYVYDIGMRNTNHPWFFGNDILIHNSCYFTAYPVLKDSIETGDVEWNKDIAIDVYNQIAKDVSATFPQFLKDRLNVPISQSTGVIASSREIVSSTSIWITKKRYAALMIDKDNIRYDVHGKEGKVKAMGLDLKRADTPKFVQDFLSDILLDTLTSKGEDYVIEKIKEFKKQFKDMKPWEQGTPKAVNKMTYYKDMADEYLQKKMRGADVEKVRIPGHVMASLNWNNMRDMQGDKKSMRISDGQKVIVCRLKVSATNLYDSIAYPIDERHLPDWFINMPFDSEMMMASIVDKKVKNLLGTLSWDLSRTDPASDHFESLFGW